MFIIINPISGASHKGFDEFKSLVESTLDLSIYDPEIFVTSYAGHAGEIAMQGMESDVKYFVVAGGDGTVNEVGAVLSGTDAILGIIPAGSGNGLANHLEIPLKTTDAISLLNNRKTLKIDSCSVNGVFFVSIAGIGFDALVARQFAKSKRRGFLTYASIVMKEYFSYKPRKYVLTLDGKKLKTFAFFISFANSSQFGNNTRIAPDASITDGLIDVCIVKKPPVRAIPWIVHLLFRRKIEKSKYMVIYQASEILVKRKKGKVVNIDGEAVKLEKELKIELRPASLNVVVP